MTNKGLSLERLESFLSVVNAGGIARAAPSAPVRQSQLSRQLGELERALGVALFEKGTQGPRVPSAAGALLARLFRDFERGLDDVRREESGPFSLSLGAGDSVIRWLLVPVARGLSGVRLEACSRSTDEIVEELRAGTLDVGIVRMADALPDELRTARIGTIEYALFAPRGERKAPLAVATGEPALTALLEAQGPAALYLETFPQVASAVRSGFSGVLPTIARAELEGATRGPVLSSSALALAWRARLDDVRPAFIAVRRRLVRLLRAALG
jgi:DNA-binding transcriptional LysR family regulator